MRKWILGLGLIVLPAAGCMNDTADNVHPAVSAAPSRSAAVSTPPTASPSAASVSPSPKTSALPSPQTGAAASPKSSTGASTGVSAPAQAKAIIEARAQETVTAIKNKDMAVLKNMTHPDKGIRFSPYCYVDVKKDLVFKTEQLESLTSDKTVHTWGSYDGSGEPIKLSFADFYSKFVYDHDYAKPEKTGYNETFGKSNTVNNIRTIYPESIVVEYYFSGFDAKLEGHDWASLSLVFEKKGDIWYLSGLVRNQWTI